MCAPHRPAVLASAPRRGARSHRCPPTEERVFRAPLPLLVHAVDSAEAWDMLERRVAPIVLTVAGVRDLHVPRRRDIAMIAPGIAAGLLRVTICAPDRDAAFAVADGPVRRALTGVPSINCAAPSEPTRCPRSAAS